MLPCLELHFVREIINVFVSLRIRRCNHAMHTSCFCQGRLVLNLSFLNSFQDYSKDDDEQLRAAIENSKAQF